MDYIKVTPAWNMARVGGVVFPKMVAQFEAVAYNHGPDGKPDTKDDISLGPVDATWTTEEYTATFDDDDKAFVGDIDAKSGLFTPAADGPNPKRSGNRNNVGDVWVVATYTPPGRATAGLPMRARSHLVVTVPLYMRWDFFTLGQK
jgi:quinohemoprotein amine dehydrogenase